MTIAPQAPTSARPTLVGVIGWIYVAFGAFAIFGGLMAEVMSLSGQFSPDKMHFDAQPGPWRLFEQIFRYYWLIGIVEFLAGVVMLLAGRAFLKLRPWSRPVVELIAWLGLAYNVTFGAWWVWAVGSMRMDAGARFLIPMMVGMGVAGILVGSVPIVLLIVGVRGKTVRGAFASR